MRSCSDMDGGTVRRMLQKVDADCETGAQAEAGRCSRKSEGRLLFLQAEAIERETAELAAKLPKPISKPVQRAAGGSKSLGMWQPFGRFRREQNSSCPTCIIYRLCSLQL